MSSCSLFFLSQYTHLQIKRTLICQIWHSDKWACRCSLLSISALHLAAFRSISARWLSLSHRLCELHQITTSNEQLTWHCRRHLNRSDERFPCSLDWEYPHAFASPNVSVWRSPWVLSVVWKSCQHYCTANSFNRLVTCVFVCVSKLNICCVIVFIGGNTHHLFVLGIHQNFSLCVGFNIRERLSAIFSCIIIQE